MLRSKHIIVGKIYINNTRKTARQVLEADQHMVVFYNYHLDTGNSCHSSSQCTKRDFINWADHEATPAELASLRYRQMEELLDVPQSPKQEAMPLVIARPALLFRNDNMQDKDYILD